MYVVHWINYNYKFEPELGSYSNFSESELNSNERTLVRNTFRATDVGGGECHCMFVVFTESVCVHVCV